MIVTQVADIQIADLMPCQPDKRKRGTDSSRQVERAPRNMDGDPKKSIIKPNDFYPFHQPNVITVRLSRCRLFCC